MKKFFSIGIFVFLTHSILFAESSRCLYAYQKATDASNNINKYNLNSKESACKMADALEETVNWMGTMQIECSSNFFKQFQSTFELNKVLLLTATSKCGH